jgi:hypothetical protein
MLGDCLLLILFTDLIKECFDLAQYLKHRKRVS